MKRTYNNCEADSWGTIADIFSWPNNNLDLYFKYGGTGFLGCNKCKNGFFSMKLDDDYELSTCYGDDFGLSNKGVHPGNGP